LSGVNANNEPNKSSSFIPILHLAIIGLYMAAWQISDKREKINDA
jgi:hypothetical protein